MWRRGRVSSVNRRHHLKGLSSLKRIVAGLGRCENKGKYDKEGQKRNRLGRETGKMSKALPRPKPTALDEKRRVLGLARRWGYSGGEKLGFLGHFLLGK